MEQPQERSAAPRRLSDFIRERADQILAEWEQAVRHLRPARQLGRLALLDHLPEFLTDLSHYVAELRAGHDARPDDSLPEIHALERLEVGYDLRDVVEEYEALRECIVNAFVREASPAMRSAEMPRFHRAIGQAISTAVTRYTAARDRTLIALDRIATVALGTENVELFLRRCLSVLLETTASVASAAVLLREGDELVVRAAVGPAQEHTEGLRVPIGQDFPGTVAERGAPVLVHDAATDPLVTGATLHRHATRALYGVPMQIGGELIGVAMMGSLRTHEFSNEDKLLFRTAVARASVLVLQAQLREAERAQRSLYESLLRAQSDLRQAVTITEQGRFVYVNDAMCELSGYARDELLAMGATVELVAPEQREEIARYVRARHEQAGTQRYVAHIRRKDGSRVLLEVAARAMTDTRSIAISRDVTEEVRLHEDLRVSEERLRLALDAANIGTFDMDLRQQELRADARALEIFGFPPGPTPPLQRWYELIDESERDRVRQAMGRLGEEGHLTLDLEYRVFKPGQGGAPVPHWVVVRGGVTMDDQQRPRLVGTVLDVTDRKQQEERLAREVEFRDQVMAILGHDLRNPLGAIQLSAATLQRRADLPEAVQRSAQRIAQSSARMAQMIRDLLDFARARYTGQLPLSPAPTDVAQLARQVIDELETANPGRRLLFDAQGDTRGSFDAARLAQALSNLASNALSYGDSSMPVRVTVTGLDHELRVRVHNEGTPIPAEVIPTLFEAFRRGAAVAERGSGREGLGLGLYIVSQVVKAHQGRIEVTSSAENGTDFVVVLPRGGGQDARPPPG